MALFLTVAKGARDRDGPARTPECGDAAEPIERERSLAGNRASNSFQGKSLSKQANGGP
jgi:hypothetical protein